MRSENRLERWEILVRSGERFSDFQPYVPAIDDAGDVVFQAARVDGGTGVYVWQRGLVEELLSYPAEGVVASHPDRNTRGDVCVYLAREDTSSALVGVHAGKPIVYADTRAGSFRSIGPLGPVIDEAGRVGFRATRADGGEAICLWADGEIRGLATTLTDFSRFHGLPVMAGDAGLVFRADRPDGMQGVYLARQAEVVPVFERRAGEGEVAFFPTMNSSGVIACGWVDPAAEAHVLTVSPAGVCREVDTGALRFRSLRGFMLSAAGELLFTGTPEGGQLGVYRVGERGAECLLALGDELDGGVVSGFALNPVSINAGGQVVVRILFEDGGQVIAMHG